MCTTLVHSYLSYLSVLHSTPIASVNTIRKRKKWKSIIFPEISPRGGSRCAEGVGRISKNITVPVFRQRPAKMANSPLSEINGLYKCNHVATRWRAFWTRVQDSETRGRTYGLDRAHRGFSCVTFTLRFARDARRASIRAFNGPHYNDKTASYHASEERSEMWQRQR